MMKKRVKKLILKALRSGEYQQTSGAMKRVTSKGCEYCIMGLFCRIYQEEEGLPNEVWTPLKGSLDGLQWRSTGCLIPDEVANWAGIRNLNYLVPPNGIDRSFMVLNDSDHMTFPQFADLIEEQL